MEEDLFDRAEERNASQPIAHFVVDSEERILDTDHAKAEDGGCGDGRSEIAQRICHRSRSVIWWVSWWPWSAPSCSLFWPHPAAIFRLRGACPRAG